MDTNIFIPGPISPSFISESINKHQSKTKIGAHDIFLGQVRADTIYGKTVKAIEYTAYEAMALRKLHDIRENTFSKYALTCMHIYHSLGTVKKGEICFFVFASAPHRKPVFEAIEYIVDEVKSKVPIFGKEIFKDNSHTWKVNS